jgi:hypothetical protein
MSQNILLGLTILSLCLCSLNALPYADCESSINGNFYSLDQMKNGSGWLTQGPIATSNVTNITTNVTVFVDFCENLNNSLLINQGCSSAATVAILNTFTTPGINSTTTTNYTCITASNETNPQWQMQQNSNPNGGLSSNLTDSNGYSITINLACGSGNSPWNVTYANIDENSHTIYINASSTYACPKFSAQLLWQFMEKYKALFVPIFIIIGLFECFFGLKMLKPTLFMVGALASFFLIMIFFFTIFVHADTTTKTEMILFGVALLPALAIGYVCVQFEKVGIFGLGAWLGVFLGLILYEAVIAHFNPASYVLYVLISILGVVAGGLSVWLFKDIIIFATGLLGSYAAIRSASVLIGGYPNEFEIVHNIEATGNPDVTWSFYVYLVFIVGMAIGGIIFQFKTKKDEENDEEANLYRNNLPDN